VTEQYRSFVSVCIAQSSIGIFGCDFFHLNFLQYSHSEIRFLTSTCASLYCSHAKQIREDLDELQQAKVILPSGNRRTIPQRDRETYKMTKARLGLMPWISGS